MEAWQGIGRQELRRHQPAVPVEDGETLLTQAVLGLGDRSGDGGWRTAQCLGRGGRKDRRRRRAQARAGGRPARERTTRSRARAGGPPGSGRPSGRRAARGQDPAPLGPCRVSQGRGRPPSSGRRSTAATPLSARTGVIGWSVPGNAIHASPSPTARTSRAWPSHSPAIVTGRPPVNAMSDDAPPPAMRAGSVFPAGRRGQAARDRGPSRPGCRPLPTAIVRGTGRPPTAVR